jgi:hypothetical protein
MLDGFLIDDRKRAGLRGADRADIMVWLVFIRVIFAATEHLGRCFQLRVYLESDSGFIRHILSDSSTQPKKVKLAGLSNF